VTTRYDRRMNPDQIIALAAVLSAPVPIGGLGATVIFSRRQQRADERRLAATENLLVLMRAQEQARRTPRLSAEVTYDQYLRLVVWLDSGEELASLRLILTEARDYDCPVGFRVGAQGVPAFESMDEQSLRLGGWWDAGGSHWAVVVRPYADAPERLSPGQAVVFGLEKRANASQSSTSRAIRLTVRCRADDGTQWEVPVPVPVRPEAADIIDGPEPREQLDSWDRGQDGRRLELAERRDAEIADPGEA
jgi:hypothetical protein